MAPGMSNPLPSMNGGRLVNQGGQAAPAQAVSLNGPPTGALVGLPGQFIQQPSISLSDPLKSLPNDAQAQVVFSPSLSSQGGASMVPDLQYDGLNFGDGDPGTITGNHQMLDLEDESPFEAIPGFSTPFTSPNALTGPHANSQQSHQPHALNQQLMQSANTQTRTPNSAIRYFNNTFPFISSSMDMMGQYAQQAPFAPQHMQMHPGNANIVQPRMTPGQYAQLKASGFSPEEMQSLQDLKDLQRQQTRGHPQAPAQQFRAPTASMFPTGLAVPVAKDAAPKKSPWKEIKNGHYLHDNGVTAVMTKIYGPKTKNITSNKDDDDVVITGSRTIAPSISLPCYDAGHVNGQVSAQPAANGVNTNSAHGQQSATPVPVQPLAVSSDVANVNDSQRTATVAQVQSSVSSNNVRHDHVAEQASTPRSPTANAYVDVQSQTDHAAGSQKRKAPADMVSSTNGVKKPRINTEQEASADTGKQVSFIQKAKAKATTSTTAQTDAIARAYAAKHNLFNMAMAEEGNTIRDLTLNYISPHTRARKLQEAKTGSLLDPKPEVLAAMTEQNKTAKYPTWSPEPTIAAMRHKVSQPDYHIGLEDLPNNTSSVYADYEPTLEMVCTRDPDGGLRAPEPTGPSEEFCEMMHIALSTFLRNQEEQHADDLDTEIEPLLEFLQDL